MHILVLGQSNVANHCAGAAFHARGCWAWHDGAPVPLGDPVAGGTGIMASVWPRVALRLKALGETEVVVSLRAVGGSSSSDWTAGGRHQESLIAAAARIDTCPLPVSHIVFHQGESDTLAATPRADYVARVGALIETAAALWPAARFVLCRASRVQGRTDAGIVAAQNALIARYRLVPGPDTDTLGPDCRYDDTHFNEAGLTRFAVLLVDVLRAGGQSAYAHGAA